MQTALAIWGALGTLSSIVFAVIAFARTRKSDAQQDGQKDGTILSDIGYIKAGVDDIKGEQRQQRSWNESMIGRVVAVEQSAASAHKRIDRLDHLSEKRRIIAFPSAKARPNRAYHE